MAPITAIASLDDAMEAIRVATAIGLTVVAPQGTVVYSAFLYATGEGHNVPLGVFSSREAAQARVSEYIVSEWFSEEYMPWADRSYGEDPTDDPDTYITMMEEWVRNSTPEQVLEICSRSFSDVGYDITAMKVG